VTHSETRTAKRGYLANVWTVPPLVYPFQYNPTQLTDTKRVEWTTRTPTFVDQTGIASLQAGFGAATAEVAASGAIAGVRKLAGMAKEVGGRAFSGAELKQFKEEKERALNFRFQIDGREPRAGEPGLRRNEAGDILADLALLRSFVYPQTVDWFEIVKAVVGGKTAAEFTKLWFNEPPTAVLVLGDMSMEGFVTDLRITESHFNSQLNPVRGEVEITMIEKIDSLSFILDSLKRVGRTFAATAYEDIPKVLI
jgi:hypothetical protein